MKSESLSVMLAFLMFFSFVGWYMAESDNQILVKENAVLKARAYHHE